MAVLFTYPFVQFFDDNGDPLSGGKIYTYQAGTTTPKATYTTSDATIQNTNPIVLDAAGRAVVFIQGSYRIDTYDANDVLIRSVDNVTSFATLESANDAFFQSFSGNGTQTSFTLSETLGTESASLLIFVSRGTESYVTNGTFATDTGWTKGSGWTITGGEAVASGTTSNSISQTSPRTLVDGKAYRITYTVTRAAGGVYASIGGGVGVTHSTSGTYTEIIIAGSTQEIAFVGASFTGTVDTVTIENLDLLGYEIQDPATYTVNGTLLDFAVAPPTGTNNIYVFSPTQLVGAAAAAADQAQAAADAAEAALATIENQKIVWQGDWAAGTYQINDAVQYEGNSWIATAVTTDTPSLASADWDLLAEKGADGTGGIVAPTSNQTGAQLRATGAGTYDWSIGITAIASAATVDLTAVTAPMVQINGTTTITSFGTPNNSGREIFVLFANTGLTLTHDANTLILPGNANITTTSGDVAIFTSRSGNGWRCSGYMKRNGKSVIGPASTDITDSTATGRSVLTAASTSASRTAIGTVEGTFVPTIVGTTSAGTGTYTSQQGTYQQYGNRVVFALRVAWTAHTGTGNMRIAGLPVAAASTPTNVPVNLFFLNTTSSSGQWPMGMVIASSQQIGIYQTQTGGGPASLTETTLDTAAEFYVAGTYFV